MQLENIFPLIILFNVLVCSTICRILHRRRSKFGALFHERLCGTAQNDSIRRTMTRMGLRPRGSESEIVATQARSVARPATSRAVLELFLLTMDAVPMCAFSRNTYSASQCLSGLLFIFKAFTSTRRTRTLTLSYFHVYGENTNTTEKNKKRAARPQSL
jgi:hypothetical protein